MVEISNLSKPSKYSDELLAFVEELRRQDVARKTLVNYRSDVGLFAKWFEGTRGEPFSAAAVTPTDIRDYRSYLMTTAGAKPATANRRLAALRKFFGWAKGVGLVTDRPTDAVRGVEEAPRAPKSLDRKEIDRLIREVENAKHPRDIAIVQVLRHTGLRVGELAALRLGDITISERKGTVTVRSGKGSKYRVVPLNVDARRAIEAYQKVRPEVADDHLFISQRGAGIGAQAIENLVKKYARKAGLEAVTPHTLRHTFGKSALDAGVDLVTVAALLGHDSVETTAIYTHPSARDLERAVERIASD
jgi:site-specific recombinase XerD